RLPLHHRLDLGLGGVDQGRAVTDGQGGGVDREGVLAHLDGRHLLAGRVGLDLGDRTDDGAGAVLDRLAGGDGGRGVGRRPGGRGGARRSAGSGGGGGAGRRRGGRGGLV